MSLADLIPQVVLSACILHNFIFIQDENEINENVERDENNLEVQENARDNVNEEDDDINDRLNSGELKRNYIASIL